MESLVVYSSQTGNTRKLAEAVYEALPGKKELYPVDEAPDPSDYDFIAVGFWFMQGKPDPKSTEFLGRIGKKPEPPVWLTDAPDAIGHPSDADIEVLSHQLSELFASDTR